MSDIDFIEGHWIYDIETYPNCFTFCGVYANGSGIRVFEVSDRKNEMRQLLSFLRNIVIHKHSMVGFNNRFFDYGVLHHILEKAKKCKNTNTELNITAKEIYDVAMKIINSTKGGSFGVTVPDNDVIIRQIDLYKIHHFDNKARSTSLKMLEVNMRSDNVEDLPFPVGKYLTSDEIDTLISYNKHDVMQTLKFYYHTLEAIRFREQLSDKYGFDCTNFNDTKIGKEYFIRRLEKSKPGCCYTKRHGRMEKNQTKRDKIVIKDILLPYLKYERPEFQAVYDWFSRQVITETKGVFADIPEYQLGSVAEFADMVTKQKKFTGVPSVADVSKMKAENPLMWIEERELKSPKGAKSYWACHRVAETMNVVVNRFRFDFGVGGIHGSIDSSVVLADDEYTILDCDVSSLYPSLSIANKIYPEHLGLQFCKIYEDVYKERKMHPKGSPENAVMKLALNGSYGETNNEFSPLYDPQATMKITIGGQLSLCMLAEKFFTLDGLTIIQINTDGVTVRVKRKDVDRYYEICREWEQITNLQLEYAEYEKMFVRDVNSYIALYTNGKIKQKGAYEYKDLGWYKNHSCLVVPMAVEHELLGKGTAEDFILNHKDKFDFMLRTKVDRSSRLVLVDEDGTETQLQNICRYYPSTKGGKLVKIMPPLKGKEEAGERRLSIDAEWNVVPCNDISEFNWDIDYNYYITEARKLIDPLFKKEGGH